MESTLANEALKVGIKDSYKERFKGRRSKIEIMADILSVAKGGARKTEIVYKANLNFHRVERYLPFLKERGLIAKSGAVYWPTEKGEAFLSDYQTMKDLLLLI